MPAISVRLDLSSLSYEVEHKIGDKLDEAVYDKRLKRNLASKWAELINPYVPMKSGNLRSDVGITEAGNIRYRAINKYGDQYSKYQYYGYNQYGSFPDTNRHTKGTHKYWDQYAIQDGKIEELAQYAKVEIIRRMRRG